MFKHEKKKQNKFGLMAVLMMVTPLVLAGIVACYYYLRNNGMSWIPALKWNDEAAYYQLIKTCITTGQPLGYWGFNGNHAIVGTGSAWSPAIIWPYAIWVTTVKGFKPWCPPKDVRRKSPSSLDLFIRDAHREMGIE